MWATVIFVFSRKMFDFHGCHTLSTTFQVNKVSKGGFRAKEVTQREKALAVQACGYEFKSKHTHQKPGLPAYAYNPSFTDTEILKTA